MAKEKASIVKSKVILAEGEDAYWFFRNHVDQNRDNEIQVFNFGGITQLTAYLRNFQNLDNFQSVTSILIFRDAETSAIASMQSVNSSLKTSRLVSQDLLPFVWTAGSPKIAVGLFPGLDDAGSLIPSGTLEDLCLELFTDRPLLADADSFLATLESARGDFTRRHKNHLHTVLSSTDKHVGLKLGETVKTGAYDLSHPRFAPFQKLISEV